MCASSRSLATRDADFNVLCQRRMKWADLYQSRVGTALCVWTRSFLGYWFMRCTGVDPLEGSGVGGFAYWKAHGYDLSSTHLSGWGSLALYRAVQVFTDELLRYGVLVQGFLLVLLICFAAAQWRRLWCGREVPRVGGGWGLPACAIDSWAWTPALLNRGVCTQGFKGYPDTLQFDRIDTLQWDRSDTGAKVPTTHAMRVTPRSRATPGDNGDFEAFGPLGKFGMSEPLEGAYVVGARRAHRLRQRPTPEQAVPFADLP